MTTKITSFPSLHSDQGHGLTKVGSPQEKQQITKQKIKLKRPSMPQSRSGKGGGRKGGSWKRGSLLQSQM